VVDLVPERTDPLALAFSYYVDPIVLKWGISHNICTSLSTCIKAYELFIKRNEMIKFTSCPHAYLGYAPKRCIEVAGMYYDGHLLLKIETKSRKPRLKVLNHLFIFGTLMPLGEEYKKLAREIGNNISLFAGFFATRKYGVLYIPTQEGIFLYYVSLAGERYISALGEILNQLEERLPKVLSLYLSVTEEERILPMSEILA